MTDHWGDDDFDLPDDAEVHHEQEPLPLEDHADLLHHEPDLPDQADFGDQPAAAVPDLAEPDIVGTTDMFPPSLDVELPEPVDGFPWIDTATLGSADPAGFTAPAEPVSAQEIAAYAGADIDGDADPWATLAASEDPATSALARWWTPDEQ